MRRIVLNFQLCQLCQKCQAKCSYPYHSGNNGIEAIRERVMSTLYCRKCQERSCEKVCPAQALTVEESIVLKRNIFRCLNCYSCALACPFGVLYQAYLVASSKVCDLCQEREPECVKSCPQNALQIIEVKNISIPENIRQISELIFVWNQKPEKEKQ